MDPIPFRLHIKVRIDLKCTEENTLSVELNCYNNKKT